MQENFISDTRKVYFIRLAGRCIILLISILMYIYKREVFEVSIGMNFFEKFSLLHLLWGIWIIDMFLQLIPVKAHIAIGSQKQFTSLFRPTKEAIDKSKLKTYISQSTKAAYIIMIIWIVLSGIIGVLYTKQIIDAGIMVLISVFFYVCDLVCVLIWCPFRLLIKNKCCTTCRIFNWDHLMMFLPLVAMKGFFSYSLVAFSVFIYLVWEFCVIIHPERFWENSNAALKCVQCTDKLCTQYCRRK